VCTRTIGTAPFSIAVSAAQQTLLRELKVERL
jgi:hypothetical protein